AQAQTVVELPRPGRAPGPPRHGRGDSGRDESLLPRLRGAGAHAFMGQHGSGRRELFPAGQLLALDRAGARDPRDDPRIPVARRWAQQPARGQAEEVMDAPLLAIENLRTYFYSRAKRDLIRSVAGWSLGVARGEVRGL